ncbi:MAG: Txe/YoeB family addiction module toxin [Bacteroides sp.]|nr:Txe/YoeB family addiction module toxin [Bacteroides sp.]
MEDLIKLRKFELAHYKKALKLLNELSKHPTTGTGHPEQLKGFEIPTWSRRISQKHRLVYEIHEDQIKVLVLSAYGHYD